MTSRARALARVAIEGLISRRARFEALSAFAHSHLRLESDNFTLDGFDVAPGQRRKPLVMSFKKPGEIIGNHLAKHQAMRLARMVMAYDFDRQLNPFVELGGFLFTFIGDGAPGTGKTILIQMLAGMINDYCEVAGLPVPLREFRRRPDLVVPGQVRTELQGVCRQRAQSARHRLRHHRRHRPGCGQALR